MARIIATQQPLLVKKERRMELEPLLLAQMGDGDLQEAMTQYMLREQIPIEVIPDRTSGDDPWEVDTITWVWWEVTV
jgi:hypothetical protein